MMADDDSGLDLLLTGMVIEESRKRRVNLGGRVALAIFGIGLLCLIAFWVWALTTGAL